MIERITVASDGTSGSLGALHIARALQARASGEVHLVSAVDLPPASVMDLVGDWALDELRETGIRTREEEVRAQLEEVLPPTVSWPLQVRTGPPARVIAEEAEGSRSSMIVLGFGRKRPVDRFLGTGVPLSVARLARLPLLAADPLQTELPRRILVAVDFSRFSRTAARKVPHVAREGAEVHLLHVVDLPQESRTDWVRLYRERATSLLDSLAEELHDAGVAEVTTKLLSGDTATALLGYARDCRAQLIATGSHGESYVNRILLGTVSGKLLRAAECSVLVVPPGAPGTE